MRQTRRIDEKENKLASLNMIVPRVAVARNTARDEVASPTSSTSALISPNLPRRFRLPLSSADIASLFNEGTLSEVSIRHEPVMFLHREISRQLVAGTALQIEGVEEIYGGGLMLEPSVLVTILSISDCGIQ